MNITNNVDYWNKSNNLDVLRTILTADDAAQSIRENLDVLLYIIPELEPMIGFDHMHPHHHLDVWEHTLLAVSLAQKDDFETKLILLLHDIGKPHSWSFDGTVRHFYGHAKASKQISQPILDRLGFPLSHRNELLEIIERHDDALCQIDIEKQNELSRKIFKVQVCDCLAHNPEMNVKRLEYISQITELFENYENSKPNYFE